MARTETVVLLRPPAKARFGDRQAGDPVPFEVRNCLFAPGPSQEPGQGAGTNMVDTDATVYPPRSILQTVPGGPRPDDRFEIRGQVYEIVGDPQDWGGRNRMVIKLRKVTG